MTNELYFEIAKGWDFQKQLYELVRETERRKEDIYSAEKYPQDYTYFKSESRAHEARMEFLYKELLEKGPKTLGATISKADAEKQRAEMHLDKNVDGHITFDKENYAVTIHERDILYKDGFAALVIIDEFDDNDKPTQKKKCLYLKDGAYLNLKADPRDIKEIFETKKDGSWL